MSRRGPCVDDGPRHCGSWRCMPARGHLVTFSMFMSSHSVLESASGRPKACGQATMACGGSRYLSWCTLWRCTCVRKSMRKSRHIRVTSVSIRVRHGAADRGNAHSRNRPFWGAPWHIGPLLFVGTWIFIFYNFRILLPSQLYETSLFWPNPHMCAPIFARFWLPIQKFP